VGGKKIKERSKSVVGKKKRVEIGGGGEKSMKRLQRRRKKQEATLLLEILRCDRGGKKKKLWRLERKVTFRRGGVLKTRKNFTLCWEKKGQNVPFMKTDR